MYSICVRQHYNKSHRYVGYGILIGVKQYGIDESWTGIKLYKTRKEATDIFLWRVLSIVNSHKDDEV